MLQPPDLIVVKKSWNRSSTRRAPTKAPTKGSSVFERWYYDTWTPRNERLTDMYVEVPVCRTFWSPPPQEPKEGRCALNWSDSNGRIKLSLQCKSHHVSEDELRVKNRRRSLRLGCSRLVGSYWRCTYMDGQENHSCRRQRSHQQGNFSRPILAWCRDLIIHALNVVGIAQTFREGTRSIASPFARFTIICRQQWPRLHERSKPWLILSEDSSKVWSRVVYTLRHVAARQAELHLSWRDFL
jgi:hypothetical protein